MTQVPHLLFTFYFLFYFIFFEKQTHTHTREREGGSNTKTYHNPTQKPLYLSSLIHFLDPSNIGFVDKLVLLQICPNNIFK